MQKWVTTKILENIHRKVDIFIYKMFHCVFSNEKTNVVNIISRSFDYYNLIIEFQ